MNSTINSQRLVKTAREGCAYRLAEELRQTGAGILGNAVEVFCNSERDLEDGRRAVQQIRDLKKACSLYIGRHATQVKGSTERGLTLATSLNESGQLKGESKEILAVGSISSISRTCSPERARFESPRPNDLAGFRKFLVDLTKVQGLFTARVLTPGLAASGLALATENGKLPTTEAGQDCPKSLPPSQHGKDSETAKPNQAKSDEWEVVSVLSDLQERLEQASVVSPTQAFVVVESVCKDAPEVQSKLPNGVVIKMYNEHRAQSTTRRQVVEKLDFETVLLRIPETSVSDFT